MFIVCIFVFLTGWLITFVFFFQALVFGVIVIAGAFIVKYVGTMVLQVSLSFSLNKFNLSDVEDITRWREGMNLMSQWQKQNLTSERSEGVRCCFCHENIKFISSSQRVMFFLLYRQILSQYYRTESKAQTLKKSHVNSYSSAAGISWTSLFFIFCKIILD